VYHSTLGLIVIQKKKKKKKKRRKDGVPHAKLKDPFEVLDSRWVQSPPEGHVLTRSDVGPREPERVDLRFRGGLVFKAHRLVYHSRVITKKKRRSASGFRRSRPAARPRFVPACPEVCTGHVQYVYKIAVPGGYSACQKGTYCLGQWTVPRMSGKESARPPEKRY